jgi:predicted Zn-dependent peptidase
VKNKDFIRFDLPNGIRCVHLPVRSAVAYCGLTIDTGSRDERPGEHGMAHLLEHALFRGTHRRKAFHINNRLENRGGELNAFTTKEETVVHAATLRGDFARAAELIADVVFRSVFPPAEIEREKTVILDEINACKDSPVDRIYDDFEDRLFAGSPLGHNILGNKRAVARYTSGEIRAFRERTYNTDRMVFSSVGGFGERRFREVCLRWFGEVEPNPRTFERAPAGETAPFREELRRGTVQAHCVLGARACSSGDPARIPLSLLVNLLGGPSANSLLNTALRERGGFSYSVEANYTPFSDTGLATVYFGTDAEKLPRCLDLIDRELRKITSEGISPRRFAAARRQFIGQFLVSREGHEGTMLGAGKSCLLYDRVDPVQEVIRRIRAVTPDQLVEAARQVFAAPLSTLIYN